MTKSKIRKFKPSNCDLRRPQVEHVKKYGKFTWTKKENLRMPQLEKFEKEFQVGTTSCLHWLAAVNSLCADDSDNIACRLLLHEMAAPTSMST